MVMSIEVRGLFVTQILFTLKHLKRQTESVFFVSCFDVEGGHYLKKVCSDTVFPHDRLKCCFTCVEWLLRVVLGQETRRRVREMIT